MKIGIITFHKAINYGAVLQSYALQKKLNNLGYDAEIIDYVCDKLKQNYKLFNLNNKTAKGIMTTFVYFPLKYIRSKKFKQFIFNNLKLSKDKDISQEELRIIAKRYDYVITGSDQVWNPKLTNGDTSYFLDFVEKCKKIAYAASFGTNSPTDQEKEFYLANIKDYSLMTVREEDSAKFISQLLNEHVESVCDPVFLLHKEEWTRVFNPKPLFNKPYIFVYCLHEKSSYKYAEQLAKKENLKIVCIPSSLKDSVDGKKDFTAGVETFLNYIYNASCVITDSFHAIAFSLIFNKSVRIVLKNEYKSLNGRLYAIAKKFCVEQCLAHENSIFSDSMVNINYNNVNHLIERERQKAIDILKSIEGNVLCK